MCLFDSLSLSTPVRTFLARIKTNLTRGKGEGRGRRGEGSKDISSWKEIVQKHARSHRFVNQCMIVMALHVTAWHGMARHDTAL